MDKIIGENYTITKKIGSGSFGQIYLGEDISTNEKVAIKLESTKTRYPQLSYEARLYMHFSGGTNIPKMRWFGAEGDYNVLVMDLLGKSLEDLYQKLGHTFSLKTVLMLADQMLTCIEYIHNKNFIHRDVKPDNFVIGLGKKANQVFVIDFGLSKKFRDTTTHVHIPYSEGKSLTGTARYASVNSLKGVEQSRRDDMESLGYVWLYLLKGNLPWMGLAGHDRKQKYDRICSVKAKTDIRELCSDLPEEFAIYIETVKALRFAETPNYKGYKRMFRKLFLELGYEYDYKYDWLLPPKMPRQMPTPVKKERVKPKPVKKEYPMPMPRSANYATTHVRRIADTLSSSSSDEIVPKKKRTATKRPIEAPKTTKRSSYTTSATASRIFRTTSTSTAFSKSSKNTGQLPKWMMEKPFSQRGRK